MKAPLAGITVIEIDNWMAAPSAGAVLADMGARVIKVEPLGGDPMRNRSRPLKLENSAFQHYDFQFDVDNRGKESIAVDLGSDAGRRVVHRLVAEAEIFMCNLLPRRQKKFGLDAKTLFALRPGLVHATLTGYGSSGPDAERPGYDVTAFFGRSGLYDAQREGDEGTVPMARPAQGDHTAGLALVVGVLGALRLAEATGESQRLETSLYEAAVWTQATDYATTAVDRAPVRRRDRHNQLTITSNRFPCGGNKWIVFNSMDGGAWERFSAALGHPEWQQDERFLDSAQRYHNMPALVDLVDAALATKTRDEWGPVFDQANIIWGPVLSLDEVAADPQAEAIGLFPTIDHPTLGSYRSVNIPVRFATAEVRPRGPAPLLGEHTRELLLEAGWSEGEVELLVEEGAVKIT